MSIAQTIVRVLQRAGLMRPVLSPNLLTNPLFEHIETAVGASNVIELPTMFEKTFACAPGWYDFGGITEGEVDDPPNPTVGALPTAFAQSGVKVVQYTGRTKGLCQKVFRGPILQGRRVRISGRYRVIGTVTDGLTGLSSWLKSDKQNYSLYGWGKAAWTSQGNTEPPTRYNYVRFENQDIQHVIRLTNSSNVNYEDGEELLVRAFDWWGYGDTDVISSTPAADIDSNDGYIAFGGASAEPGVLDQQAVRVWYLDSTFDGVPANGTQELYTETQTSTGTYHFETFVDIDAAAGLFEDNEVWVVVMPVNPADVGSMTHNAEIVLQHLSMEIVLDSDDVEDQLLGAALNQANHLPFGHAG